MTTPPHPLFRRIGLVLCSATLLAGALPGRAPALSRAPQERVDPKVQWAPSAVPDRIVLSWTGDPSTTQAVTWRTA
ncbi:MAG: hypothetical protein ACYTGX_08880, partial [Planctomycetota bacterium]